MFVRLEVQGMAHATIPSECFRAGTLCHGSAKRLLPEFFAITALQSIFPTGITKMRSCGPKKKGFDTDSTTFEPNAACTRAQALTFLWRALGSSEPTATTCPFTDVAEDAYYQQAVRWAIEEKITDGTSKFLFSPLAQLVTFLYRCMGK